MKNINAACEALEHVYNALKNGSIDTKAASEMNNAVGKIVKARTSQMQYYELRKEAPQIPFWQEEEAK